MIDTRVRGLLTSRWGRSVLGALVIAASSFGGWVGLRAAATADRAESDPVTTVLPEGVHLYGQAPEPGVLGQEYLVLQVEGDLAIGAVYLPRSEFSCFFGRVGPRQLDLKIAGDRAQEAYPYAIALEPISPLATNSSPAVGVGLQGYHRLDAPDANDLRVLEICRRRVLAVERR